MRGALANVTNARWDAVDAGGATDVRAGCVRRSRVVLTPRCWRQLGGKCPAGDGGKRGVHRGEHEVSRKATAQGRPGCSACTCMLVCAFLVRNCTRDRGCSVHPVFPAPSNFRGGTTDDAKLGRKMSREGETISASLRASDAIHLSACCAMDCFAEPVIGRAFARPVGSQ